MGAWSLGRDAVLFREQSLIPLTRHAKLVEVARLPAEETPEEKKARDKLAEYAGKVLPWIPGEVVVLYGALITLFVQNKPEDVGDTSSVVLTIGGALFAGGFVLLAAFANTSDASWRSKPLLGRAGLATVAFAIWSLTVPNSGWNTINCIAENPVETAAIAGVVGLIFSFVATGIDNRLSKKSG